ncbi:Orotidine 5'-phosphate decarboxylase [Caenispirillum salinarum AK4]|uniref:Orotidine 5'-phosphate decarboxylase n=1 Tax=Caenispirillum salinarum AK4 TaxID=1238182 RepID=K9HHI2_9PROT|nr:orotidine-5'-phosphate decarboxylase [Caenispirillum salinarum]EKV28076.1 Orotidine 5'-phosphate decarboxylase [Caenispirillum salinarum AK4]
MTPLRNPVFCALDTTDLNKATRMAARIGDTVGGIKLGLEFFTAQGRKGVEQVRKAGDAPLFLDLKFHDIPNTVAGAIRAATQLKPAIVNVHAAGGRVMMEAAARAATEAAEEFLVPRPLVLAVTVLTSMDDEDLAGTGVDRPVPDQVRALAELAQNSGMDGVVCSPHEASVLRADRGSAFKLLCPGVRPHGSAPDDQKRIMTPAEALEAGADYLVIGRPITAHQDPEGAAQSIIADLPKPAAPAGNTEDET